MEGRVKISKKLLLEGFDDHCNTRLHNRVCHSFYHMMEDKRMLKSLSLLNSSPHNYFNKHVKQAFKITC